MLKNSSHRALASLKNQRNLNKVIKKCHTQSDIIITKILIQARIKIKMEFLPAISAKIKRNVDITRFDFAWLMATTLKR